MKGYLVIYFNQRQKALQKAFDAVEIKVNLETRFFIWKMKGNVWHLQCRNNRKISQYFRKCTIKLHGLKGYLQVNIWNGLIHIY